MALYHPKAKLAPDWLRAPPPEQLMHLCHAIAQADDGRECARRARVRAQQRELDHWVGRG